MQSPGFQQSKFCVLLIAGAILALDMACSGAGAFSGPAQYQFRKWTTEDGLPQGTVQAVCRTRDGYLWIGTRLGLVRFDGSRFTVFNLANTPGMVSDNCLALAEDTDGDLWVGTEDGLLRWRYGQFERFTTAHGLVNSDVRKLAPSRAGGVWIGTLRGYCRFRAGQITNYYHVHGVITNRTAVFEDSAGKVWFNDDRVLYRLDPEAGTSVVAEVLGQNPAGSRALCFREDTQRRLWIGNYLGLYCGTDSRFVRVGTPEPRPGDPPRLNRVSAVLCTRSGDVLFAFGENGALYELEHEKLVPVVWPGGKVLDVLCLEEDYEGNVWVGTRRDGLLQLQPRPIRTLTTEHGLKSDLVWSVCPARGGGVWVGTDGDSFSRVAPDGAIETFSVPASAAGRITSILEDRDGDVWLGRDSPELDSNLWLFKDGTATPYGTRVGLSTRYVRALYQDRGGNLWVGSADGVARRGQNGQWTVHSIRDGLSTNDVRSFLEDRDGNLWMGTYGGGVNCFQGDRFKAFMMADGLVANHAWSMHQDEEGALWVVCELGIARHANGRWFSFTRQHGLHDELVNHLVEDGAGNFWVSCHRGIYRVRRQDLNAVAEGRTDRAQSVAFGVVDGMITSETNGEGQPIGCQTPDGQLWFPTVKGLAVLDPKLVLAAEAPPPVIIESVIADGEIIGGEAALGAAVVRSPGLGKPVPATPVRLRAGRGRKLQIQYTTTTLVAPERAWFRYRLDGHDQEWCEAGAHRLADYSRLRPGQYRFQVIARNYRGQWSATSATFAFSVAPHLYQTHAFYFIAASLLGVAVYGTYRFHLYRITCLQRVQQQRAIEVERRRIARDMHDDLGSNLTQISLLSELALRHAHEPAQVETHLRKIAETTRGTFRALDEIIWAASPGSDTLESLVSFLCKFAQDYLRTAGLPCRIEAPAEVPLRAVRAEIRHHLYLVLKEALTNIVRHAQASEVWLRMAIQQGTFELVVEDDGTGLAPAERGSEDGQDGLTNMQQRLKALGGHFDAQSSPGNGTRLSVRLNL